MANTNDPKTPTSLDRVLDAFRSEREYQRRRWGYRQPDGQLLEARHSVADFVLYMQDYYHQARHKASREAGVEPSLEALRKVVALGFACIEQWDRHYEDDGGQPYTVNDIAETIAERSHRSGLMVPLTLRPDYSNYMLRIAFVIAVAATKAGFLNNDDALCWIWDLVQIGVECFSQYGIIPRDLSQPIINGRDGLPA